MRHWWGVASLVAAAVLAPAPACAADGWRQGYEVVEVADGILAYVADESPGSVVQGNVVAVSGTGATLLVDSGQYVGLARDIVADLEARGLPPVRYLVNTHWHGDHLLANFVFKEAFPGLEVIQHAETARAGQREYAEWATKKVPGFRDYPAQLEKTADAGVNSQGVALDDGQREALRIDAGLIRRWLADSDQSRWDPPDRTITADTSIDLGEREVELRFFGPANTTGDLALWDPRTRTLVTGDVVVAPTPYAFGSYQSEWIGVLDAMRALRPARIVPGHGPVMDDDGYLLKLAALLAETRTQVRAALARGQSLDEMRREIALPEYQRLFAGDDRDRGRAFRVFYLSPAIAQAYKEARGEPRSE